MPDDPSWEQPPSDMPQPTTSNCKLLFKKPCREDSIEVVEPDEEIESQFSDKVVFYESMWL